MRKIVYRAALAVALLGSAVSSFAQKVDLATGNGLYAAYQEYKKGANANPFDAGLLIGYIQGVGDGDQWRVIQGAKAYWCVPENAQLSQSIDIVGQFLESHPAQRNLPAGLLVNTALIAAWPCPHK